MEDTAAIRQEVKALLECGLPDGAQTTRLEVRLTQVETHEAAHRSRVRADRRVEDGGRRIGGHERGLAGRGRTDDDEESPEDEHQEDRPDSVATIGWALDRRSP